MNDKLKVGQKVYVQPIGNAGRYANDIRSDTISKVGRKYFELKDHWPRRFIIDSLLHDGKGYASSYKVWLSMDDYNYHIEEVELRKKIKNFFYHWHFRNVPMKMDDLKTICNLIDKYQGSEKTNG